MTRAELRLAAIDETKAGGDLEKARVLALIYMGDCLDGVAVCTDSVADGMKTLAVEVGSIGVAVSR